MILVTAPVSWAVMKNGNIAPGVGIEPASLAIWVRVLTITLARLLTRWDGRMSRAEHLFPVLGNPWFEPRLSQTEDFKIDTCSFLAGCPALLG